MSSMVALSSYMISNRTFRGCIYSRRFSVKTITTLLGGGCNASCRSNFRRRPGYNTCIGYSGTLHDKRQQPKRLFGIIRSSSTSSNTEDERKSRLTTIRLYRILQRQCLDLASSSSSVSNNGTKDDDAVLIQPQLRANDWGRQFKFMLPPPTTVEDLFRLFHDIYEDEEDEDPRNNNYDDDDDDDENEVVLAVAFSDNMNMKVELASKPSSSSSSASAKSVVRASRGSIRDWYDHVLHGQHHYPSEPEGIPIIPTCWTTVSQLRMAIRRAFKTKYSNDTSSMEVAHLHKWAICAIQFLRQQTQLWRNSTITTTNNIRVVATSRYESACRCCTCSNCTLLVALYTYFVLPSRSQIFKTHSCIGTTTPTSALPPTATPSMLETKYRFAYRIRVENLSPVPADSGDASSSSTSDTGDRTDHVQLLGRHWHVQELEKDEIDLAAVFKGSNGDEAEEANLDVFAREPLIVDAPYTGAGKWHIVSIYSTGFD